MRIGNPFFVRAARKSRRVISVTLCAAVLVLLGTWFVALRGAWGSSGSGDGLIEVVHQGARPIPSAATSLRFTGLAADDSTVLFDPGSGRSDFPQSSRHSQDSEDRVPR